MNKIIYKVVCIGGLKNKDKKMSLTFKKINFDDPLKIPLNFFTDLKKLSESNKNILIFKNIEEVLKLGEKKLSNIINYYILLFQVKNNKEGLLIGNTKKEGDIVIGIWPFNKKDEYSKNQILSVFNNLIEKHTEYDEICLIN